MASTEPIASSSLFQPPLNTSFMGVVIGVAQHFGTGLSTAEYFAEGGFAFAVNIHPEICPSGPYCWDHEPVLDCLRQLGIDGKLIASTAEDGTREAREEIEAQVTAGFNEAIVSMMGLDHQLIVNCDAEKMEFALPWGTDPGSCMESLKYDDWRDQKKPPPFGFYRFDSCEVAPKEARVQQSLDIAIQMFESPSKFEIEDDKFGPNSYELWIEALEKGLGDLHGQWWNATVWCECRYFAFEYFREWPFGSNSQTEELAELFKKSSDLLREASSQDLGNEAKVRLIREVQETEGLVPPLLRELSSTLACNSRQWTAFGPGS